MVEYTPRTEDILLKLIIELHGNICNDQQNGFYSLQLSHFISVYNIEKFS